jgi:hypothetical protein
VRVAMKESSQQVSDRSNVGYLETDSSQDLLKQVKSKSRSDGPLNARAKVIKKCVLVQFVVQREHLKSIMSAKYVWPELLPV